jgi:hypothetical protein
MKKLLPWALVFIFSCNTSNKETNKYYIIIETSTRSILTGHDETEGKTDSIYAKDDLAAFDSAAANVYGIMVADSILLEALRNAGNEKDYSYYSRKIKNVRILNSSGIDISNSIPDSMKMRIYGDYGIKPFK